MLSRTYLYYKEFTKDLLLDLEKYHDAFVIKIENYKSLYLQTAVLSPTPLWLHLVGKSDN